MIIEEIYDVTELAFKRHFSKFRAGLEKTVWKDRRG